MMGSRRLLAVSAVFFVASAVTGAPTPAEEPQAAAGNPAHGKAISYTCLGCHGVPGYRNAYPNYSVPKLEGQQPDYLVAALKAYKSGERSHLTMHSQASELSEQDMRDIAVFFAGEPLKGDGHPDGQTPAAAQVCVACHGAEGVGIMPIYPNLAGQHADYIVRALSEYKKGGRKNPVMAPMAGQLNDAQMQEVAAYYSHQQPALKTVERPATFLSAKPAR